MSNFSEGKYCHKWGFVCISHGKGIKFPTFFLKKKFAYFKKKQYLCTVKRLSVWLYLLFNLNIFIMIPKNLCTKFIRFQCLLTAIMWCVQISAQPNHEKGDSVNVTPFSKIMVIGNQKTSLIFCQDNHYALTIAGCNRENVNIEHTNDSTLLIYPNMAKSQESILIKIYAPEWNSIFASLIENIRTNGSLKADKLKVDASLVKTMDLNVQVNSLNLDAEAEICSVSGSCEQAMIDFNGSPSLQSVLQAKDLRIKELHLKNGPHTKVFAQASKSLWLQNGLLSEITIYGSPSEIKNDTESCQIHILPKE